MLILEVLAQSAAIFVGRYFVGHPAQEAIDKCWPSCLTGYVCCSFAANSLHTDWTRQPRKRFTDLQVPHFQRLSEFSTVSTERTKCESPLTSRALALLMRTNSIKHNISNPITNPSQEHS